MVTEKLDVGQIKGAHRIEDVIGRCGVRLEQNPTGERLQANCPFPGHEDSTPSFMVFRPTQTFRCFGCNVGGDVFDFLQAYYGWTFAESLHYLAAKAGLARGPEPALTRGQGRGSARPPLRSIPPRKEREVADHRPVITLATQVYADALFRSPQTLDYVRARGVTDETARRLRLGCGGGDALMEALARQPHLRASASACGLLSKKGRERLAGRLVVPEIRERQALYLIGRVVPPRASRYKYLGLSVSKRLLGYGEACRTLQRSPGQGVQGILVVEGALDYVIALQWRLPVLCVALLSTWASRLQLQELADLYARVAGVPILLFLDADAPGSSATPNLLEQLQRRALPALALPPIARAKDIGDLGPLPDGRSRFVSALAEALAGGGVV